MPYANILSRLPAPLDVAAVAALYFAAAKLCLLFPPPLGNVAWVWIPSGVALAALLTRGWRGAAGVLLGSFAVNLHAPGAAGGGILVSGAIAVGAVLQAALAAWLFARYVLERRGTAPPPGEGGARRRDATPPADLEPTAWFLRALGVFAAASFLAAGVGVTSLCAGGYAEWGEFASLSRTWWLGDLAGYLVAAPGALHASGLRLARARFGDPVQLVFALTFFGIGVLAWSLNSLYERVQFEQQLERRLFRITDSLRGETSDRLHYGQALQAFFNSSPGEISPPQFTAFTRGILEMERSTQALEYIPRVPAAQRQAWEERGRREAGAGYAIRERGGDGIMAPAGARAEYFPVHYVEPLAGNEAALGFDLGSEATRRAALEQARDSGRAASTAPLMLVQKDGPLWGLLLFHPLYRHASPVDTLEARRENLTGYTLVVVMPHLMFDHLPEHAFTRRAVDLGWFDTGPAGAAADGAATASGQALVAQSGGADLRHLGAWRRGMHAVSTFEFAGRQQMLVLRPSPGHRAPAASMFGWALLVTLAGLSGALVMAANERYRRDMALAAERASLETLVQERTAAHEAAARAADALGEREARYRTLTESTSAAIFVHNGVRLVDVNAAALQLTGYSRRELLTLDAEALVDAEFYAAYRARMRSALAGVDAGKPLEVRIRRKDSAACWLSVTMAIHDFNRGSPLTIVTAIDVTERRRVEESLVQAQKMEAVGQLTGGLAHDFNNLLGVIVGNLDLLRAAVADNERARKRVETAIGAAMRGANLTRALLAVARRQTLAPERVDLVAHMRMMLDLVKATVGSSIEIRDRLGDGPLVASVDLSGLDASILNLVVNARDAMPDGGAITLSIAPRTFEGGGAEEALLTVTAGSYAVIAVSDNGPGMSPAVAARAFEPFFTTKDRDRGTGLGLAMVHGFCRQSGGDARIYSEPGHGTAVRLYLPLGALADDDAAPLAEPAEAPRGIERVLLVDDEYELLEVTQAWLEDLGYAVDARTDPHEALRALEEHAYDLLVTDVVMRGLNGFDLAARARKHAPGLALLYVSGFADAAIAHEGKVEGELLEKPFDKRGLARAVRRAFDRAAARRRDTERAGGQ